MPKIGRKLYYWDSCTFIAWINGSKSQRKDLIAGLQEIAKEVTENRAVLCTSVLIETEVLKDKLTEEQINKIQNLFKRKNVLKVGIDSRILSKSHDIRNYYSQRDINISTPDAIHLATAIINKVDEFHTLDGSGKRARPNDLLRLNGDVAGYPLHIRVPLGLQPSLFTDTNPNVAKGGNHGKENEQNAQPSSASIQGGGNRSAEGQAAEEKVEPQEDARNKG